MNRMDELNELKQKLEYAPAELEFITAKAIQRAKKHKRWTTIWRTPIISFCSAALLFILLVNLFPKVAMAMGNVPILKELVTAVALDPSLKVAVENDYYQPVGESKTQDNVTVSVDYMILDAAHISLFFHIDAPVEAGSYHFDILNEAGEGLPAGISFDTMYESGKMEEIAIDFPDKSYLIPDMLTFAVTVNVDENFTEFKTEVVSQTNEGSVTQQEKQPQGKDYSFTFSIYPDPFLAHTVDSITLDQWITVEGQRIYLDCLNIYPTRTRLYLECDEANDAVLYNLGIYFEDDKGNLYDNRKNGIVAHGTPNSFDLGAIYFESSFFSNAEALTMYITDITMIEKDRLYGEVNYAKGTITNMPMGITVKQMDLDNNTLSFTLTARSEKPDQVSEIISSEYYDDCGNTYNFGSWSTEVDNGDSYFSSYYRIVNYEENKFKVRWSYAPIKELASPIEIRIR